jgi:hypothetical protein
MILSSTTYSLKKALCLLLISSLFLTSSLAYLSDDECHHDSIEQNPDLLDIEEDKSSLQEGTGRILAGSPNIRIYPYFDFLDSRASNSYASYIKTELVPPIVDYFEGALKVKYPVSGKLKLESGVSKICEHSTPSILRSGVDADFFMYYDIDTSTSFIAAAKFCHLASGTMRPIIARTSINSNQLLEPRGNEIVHEKNLVTMMHEMMHALGFTSSLFPYFLDENGKTRKGHIKTFNIAGKTRTVIDVPVLTQKLRNYYGCSSLQGAIMENNGGSGTAVSHFERKYFGYEAMTSGSIIGKRFSEFSLGMLEASGWYDIDYSYAEPFSFGQGNGCDFISASCSNAASRFDEYCTGSNRGCSATGRGGGSCNNDPNMDGCRFYYPFEYNDCENDDAADDARLADLQVFGRGAGSKCFTGTLNTRKSSNGLTSFCFKSNCVGSGSSTQVEVQVGSHKITCTKAGSQNIDGYYGSVDCPDPLTFCNGPGKQFCPRNCMGRGTCVNNKCMCNSGYSGSDCAMRV